MHMIHNSNIRICARQVVTWWSLFHRRGGSYLSWGCSYRLHKRVNREGKAQLTQQYWSQRPSSNFVWLLPAHQPCKSHIHSKASFGHCSIYCSLCCFPHLLLLPSTQSHSHICNHILLGACSIQTSIKHKII